MDLVVSTLSVKSFAVEIYMPTCNTAMYKHGAVISKHIQTWLQFICLNCATSVSFPNLGSWTMCLELNTLRHIMWVPKFGDISIKLWLT